MTYRLCVIGNSHVAAFKLGWDQLAARGDALTRAIAPTFFGAPRDGLKNLAVRDGRLVPTADFVRDHFARMSGGRADVDPAGYDGFLLVGLGASMKRALRFYRTHRWFGLQQHPGRVVASRAFARAFLAEGYGGTRLGLVVGMLSGITDKPVFATPEPYWSALLPDHVGKKGDFGWASAAASGDGDMIARLFADAVTDGIGRHATMIWQPAATVEHGIVTKSIYNKGASKFITGEGEESDAAHMNADYGAAWWVAAAGHFLPPAALPARPRRAASRRSV